MKHPSFKDLQDYFEAELESREISMHMENCNRCSEIMSEMAKVDILIGKLKKDKEYSKKEELFRDASKLLSKRRENFEKSTAKLNKKNQRKLKINLMVSELSSLTTGQLKSLVFQFATISLILFFMFRFSIHRKQISKHNLINNNVEVFYSEQRMKK